MEHKGKGLQAWLGKEHKGAGCAHLLQAQLAHIQVYEGGNTLATGLEAHHAPAVTIDTQLRGRGRKGKLTSLIASKQKQGRPGEHLLGCSLFKAANFPAACE